MLFSRTLLTSAFAALVSSQAFPTTLSPAQETKVMNDLADYLDSAAAQPAYTAAVDALASAVPTDIQSELLNDPEGCSRIQYAFTATASPSWITAIPTSVKAYFSSVRQAEASILSKDAQGPAPTNAVRVAGAVMAAGGAALALL